MIILGLTGSIAMGKSTMSKEIARRGIPVFDSDKYVHDLLGPGGAGVADVARLCPASLKGDEIDRSILGPHILGLHVHGNQTQLEKLEEILHPLVYRGAADFIAREHAKGTDQVVLDLPLLFESNGDKLVDGIILVSASQDVQRARVLARKGMNEEKFAAIKQRQLPEDEKIKRSHYVIDTGAPMAVSLDQLSEALNKARLLKGTKWPESWIKRGYYERNRSGYGNDGVQCQGQRPHR